MKKQLLVIMFVAVIFLTACGGSKLSNKSKRTIEDLLDGYVKAYTNADVETAKELFPPFYLEYAKDSLTKENLQKSLEKAKERYGDDFNITYEITKTVKLTEEELEKHNNDMAKYYNAKENATECYAYEGTMTFKGSKFEDPDPIDSIEAIANFSISFNV